MARFPDKPALPADLSDEALDPLQEEALHWLAFLHSGKETEDDWATYQNRRAMDPAHRAAAEEAERLWERLGLALRPPSRPKTGGLPFLLAGMLVTAGLTFAAGLFGEPRAYIADQRTGIGERRTVTLASGSVEMGSNTSLDVGPYGRSVTLYKGLYAIEVSHTDRTPGSRDGKPIDVTSFVTTLSFVSLDGLAPLPRPPAAKPND